MKVPWLFFQMTQSWLYPKYGHFYESSTWGRSSLPINSWFWWIYRSDKFNEIKMYQLHTLNTSAVCHLNHARFDRLRSSLIFHRLRSGRGIKSNEIIQRLCLPRIKPPITCFPMDFNDEGYFVYDNFSESEKHPFFSSSPGVHPRPATFISASFLPFGSFQIPPMIIICWLGRELGLCGFGFRRFHALLLLISNWILIRIKRKFCAGLCFGGKLTSFGPLLFFANPSLSHWAPYPVLTLY